ncbi:MAG: helix-turn-helix domain-containing protein [Patescibacteria group bacterium]
MKIADKWTILVLAALSEQPYYFGELKRKIECISQKMLTQTLRKLETDGFIERKVIKGNVTKVSYSLTKLGISLVEPLQGLQQWAITNADELDQHRQVRVIK